MVPPDQILLLVELYTRKPLRRLLVSYIHYCESVEFSKRLDKLCVHSSHLFPILSRCPNPRFSIYHLPGFSSPNTCLANGEPKSTKMKLVNFCVPVCKFTFYGGKVLDNGK
ncbi:unnamed protein product [Pipistrellus nathusii]|uniref:Uncharacterized protein n=1 Tax=Pipistrellus nathusii TaxID=59473 RepID=A0ABP0ACF1_PIPNA